MWNNGDEIKATFFAWLPVRAMRGDRLETRWLEKVTVRVEFCSGVYDEGWWDILEFAK